jgi:hypothetical protein
LGKGGKSEAAAMVVGQTWSGLEYELEGEGGVLEVEAQR